ncbi:MAG: hypothetical protein Harvfovirus10_36 [Harvfovirus sp.]|uniref:Uncharacterized protein n=1 Tax=Harvfovirus sp. TaxID=2487768 RepID=A0A3G5A144_9VIRU|nr:MAG: hypothetical protein Harvfovirus10_36 [Harvfovirus sp.]
MEKLINKLIEIKGLDIQDKNHMEVSEDCIDEGEESGDDQLDDDVGKNSRDKSKFIKPKILDGVQMGYFISLKPLVEGDRPPQKRFMIGKKRDLPGCKIAAQKWYEKNKALCKDLKLDDGEKRPVKCTPYKLKKANEKYPQYVDHVVDKSQNVLKEYIVEGFLDHNGVPYPLKSFEVLSDFGKSMGPINTYLKSLEMKNLDNQFVEEIPEDLAAIKKPNQTPYASIRLPPYISYVTNKKDDNAIDGYKITNFNTGLRLVNKQFAKRGETRSAKYDKIVQYLRELLLERERNREDANIPLDDDTN